MSGREHVAQLCMMGGKIIKDVQFVSFWSTILKELCFFIHWILETFQKLLAKYLKC